MVSIAQAVRAYRKGARMARGAFLRGIIVIGGGTCGPGFEVEAGSTLRWGPHPGIRIGRDVRFGRGVVLDVPAGAELEIEDGVKVMHYSVIAASERISIGAQTQIGECSSIRDSDHGPGNATLSMADDLRTTPTTIGAGVWIARGTAVLRGAQIGDRAVVGANSVVVRNHPVAAQSRVAGAPAKVLGTSSVD